MMRFGKVALNLTGLVNDRLIHTCGVVIVMLLMSFIGIAQDARALVVEAHAYPGRDPAMWDGLYAASDGKVYSALISEGVSAHFYVFDPVSKENRLIADMAEFFGERGKGIRTSGKIHKKKVCECIMKK